MSSLANPLVALGLGTAWGLYLPRAFGEQRFLLYFLLPAVFATASLGVSLPGLGALDLLPRRARSWGVWILLLTLGVFSGIALGRGQLRREASHYLGLPREAVCRLEGRVLEDSRPRRRGGHIAAFQALTCFDKKGNQASASARLLLFLPGENRLFWGDRVSLEGRLAEGQEGVELFFVHPENPPSPERGNSVLALRARVLLWAQRGTRELRQDWTGLFVALFLGIQDDLPPWVSDSFRRAGVVHILALSGMHLGILVVLIQVILRPLAGAGLGTLFCSLAVGIYTFIAGPRPSLLRAAGMFLLHQGLGHLGRRPESGALLAFSFLTSCLLTPGDLYSASFILSYLAMGGILFFSRRLQRFISPWIPDPLGSALAVSLAAQLTTAPYLFTVFGSLQPAALPASIILGPLTTIFLWLGIPGFLLAGITGSSEFALRGLLYPMQYLYTAIVTTASFFSRFPPWVLR